MTNTLITVDNIAATLDDLRLHNLWDLEGKTILKAEALDDYGLEPGSICLLMADGSWFSVAATERIYDRGYCLAFKDPLEMSEQHKAGLITEEQYEEFEKELAERARLDRDKRERLQYERLKKKFEA